MNLGKGITDVPWTILAAFVSLKLFPYKNHFKEELHLTPLSHLHPGHQEIMLTLFSGGTQGLATSCRVLHDDILARAQLLQQILICPSSSFPSSSEWDCVSAESLPVAPHLTLPRPGLSSGPGNALCDGPPLLWLTPGHSLPGHLLEHTKPNPSPGALPLLFSSCLGWSSPRCPQGCSCNSPGLYSNVTPSAQLLLINLSKDKSVLLPLPRAHHSSLACFILLDWG